MTITRCPHCGSDETLTAHCRVPSCGWLLCGRCKATVRKIDGAHATTDHGAQTLRCTTTEGTTP